MSDDFVRLVSQSNPASRQQYQPANGAYPPSSSASLYHNSSGQLDPFFDDEDDIPDSAFGRSTAAMQSKESGLPLTRSAAAPAGVAPDGDILQDWDDDDVPPPATQSFGGATHFSDPSTIPNKDRTVAKRKRKWKWPWKKEEEILEGERLIALNNSTANSEFCSNYVSTSKYNAITFIPKFFYGTCHVRVTSIQDI